jgi:hypothetical protein
MATFRTITNTVAAFEATNSNLTLSGEKVTSWTDLTGGGFHLVQSNDAIRPVRGSDGGIRHVDFSAGNQNLSTAPSGLFGSVAQPNTIVVRVRINSLHGSGYNNICDGTELGKRNNLVWQTATEATGRWFLHAGTTASPTIWNFSDEENWHTVLAEFNGASSAVQVDGAAKISLASGTVGTNPLDALLLGTGYTGANGANMDVRAVYVFEKLLSDPEKANVRGWIASLEGDGVIKRIIRPIVTPIVGGI